MRKNQAEKRTVLPDPVYNSVLITKAINTIMLKGKKQIAQNILYDALNLITKKTKTEGIEVFKKALENIMPSLELKVKRVAGSNYQIPVVVSVDRKQTLGLRWLVLYAKKRHEKSMVEKLANEIIDASKKVGASFKKKEDTHKMAEANKAFVHLRY